jgi:hypothetical protein
MSFWRLSFSQQSSIDALLSNLPTSSSPPSISDDQVDVPLPVTLEQLLDEDELIQECKAGNAKLVCQRALGLGRLSSWTDARCRSSSSRGGLSFGAC